MNDWRTTAEHYKNLYPAGSRVLLIHMDDPFSPIPDGMTGTVFHVDDMGQIHVKWDNGRSLALIPGEDSFKKAECD